MKNQHAPIAKRLSELKRGKPVSCTDLVRRKRTYLDLLIYPNGNNYPIEYGRFDTPEKVLGWIYHLTKKGNVTKEHLRAFIEVAKERGVNVDFHA